MSRVIGFAVETCDGCILRFKCRPYVSNTNKPKDVTITTMIGATVWSDMNCLKVGFDDGEGSKEYLVKDSMKKQLADAGIYNGEW